MLFGGDECGSPGGDFSNDDDSGQESDIEWERMIISSSIHSIFKQFINLCGNHT